MPDDTLKPPGFLEAVRVLDLSQYIPGPFATRQLGDLGADVIKIEPPQGDPMRRFMYQGDESVSPVYRHLNRGKRIVTLDLKTEAAKRELNRLIADADILLESFRPGVLARLGFDRETLTRINPGLILCSLSGYGQNGPYRLRPGHDLNYCAVTSMQILNGIDDRPVMCFQPLVDHAGAMQASIAMLAALYAKQARGCGAYLDISLFETCLSWQYLPLLIDGVERARGLLNGGAACYNIYQCSDQAYISLGALEAHFWENFCVAVDRPQWIERQFEAMPQKQLLAEVARLIGQHPLPHWQQQLDSVDCCYEPLLPPDQVAHNQQIRARKALSASGPNYPGWIDDAVLEIDDNIHFIAPTESLNWK